jgi:hypothetical protein
MDWLIYFGSTEPCSAIVIVCLSPESCQMTFGG